MGTPPRSVTLGVSRHRLEEIGGVCEPSPLFAQRRERTRILELERQLEAKIEEPVEPADVALEVRVREVVDDSRHDHAVIDLHQLVGSERHPHGAQALVEGRHGLRPRPIERVEVLARERVSNKEVAGHPDRLQGNPDPPGDREQDGRQGDRHAGPALHDRGKIGVGGIVVVPMVAPEVQAVIHQHAQGIDGSPLDRRGPTVEFCEPPGDIDLGTRPARSQHEQGLVETDPVGRFEEVQEAGLLGHTWHGIQPGRNYGRAVHPYLSRTPPVGFAHRGGAGVHPENTLRAFEHAVGLGFVYLETDVHLTRDGVLVAFHDSRLDRVTDRSGRIADLTWAEVAEARVGGTEPILRFDELMAAFPAARVNIDPKSDRSIEALAAAIRDLAVEDRVCVTAFSRRRTRKVKALVGDALCTGGGALATLATILGVGRRLLTRDVDVLQVPPSFRGLRIVRRAFVDRAHAWGMHVHVWTIDEVAEIEQLLDLGVDGIMTDEPARLREVFAARDLTLS